jgi:DNA-binding MarR family transcriptional regulator
MSTTTGAGRPQRNGSAATAPPQNDQKLIQALSSAGEATVHQIGEAAGIGRTTVRKYLAGLVERGTAKRIPGGRDGRRKLPDRFALVSRDAAADPNQKGKEKKTSERLAPGGLDKLVLTYMVDHPGESPFGPTAVARALDRSSGAVGNCLQRLAYKGVDLTQVAERPRRYALTRNEG